jgi:hypothetical protein
MKNVSIAALVLALATLSACLGKDKEDAATGPCMGAEFLGARQSQGSLATFYFGPDCTGRYHIPNAGNTGYDCDQHFTYTYDGGGISFNVTQTIGSAQCWPTTNNCTYAMSPCVSIPNTISCSSTLTIACNGGGAEAFVR